MTNMLEDVKKAFNIKIGKVSKKLDELHIQDKISEEHAESVSGRSRGLSSGSSNSDDSSIPFAQRAL